MDKIFTDKPTYRVVDTTQVKRRVKDSMLSCLLGTCSNWIKNNTFAVGVYGIVIGITGYNISFFDDLMKLISVLAVVFGFLLTGVNLVLKIVEVIDHFKDRKHKKHKKH